LDDGQNPATLTVFLSVYAEPNAVKRDVQGFGCGSTIILISLE
jgi:hypothetical protein